MKPRPVLSAGARRDEIDPCVAHRRHDRLLLYPEPRGAGKETMRTLGKILNFVLWTLGTLSLTTIVVFWVVGVSRAGWGWQS